jgi:hypothetical protein
MSISAMTQTEAITEVANILGRDSASLSADQATTYSNRIKQWLYWSHLTMARAYAFPELDQDPVSYTLSTSTNVYTFATLGLTTVRQILGITYVDSSASYKIPQKLWRTFEEDYPYVAGQTADKPRCYAIWGQRIELNRIPSEANAIQIRYNKLPADYTSASAASVYINKDDVIIAGAVAHAYSALQENDDAATWAKIFTGRLQQAIGHQLEAGDWEPEGRAFDYTSQRPSYGSAEANPLQFFNL